MTLRENLALILRTLSLSSRALLSKLLALSVGNTPAHAPDAPASGCIGNSVSSASTISNAGLDCIDEFGESQRNSGSFSCFVRRIIGGDENRAGYDPRDRRRNFSGISIRRVVT